MGIPVTGRSSRLWIYYRSTEEILGWSSGVLHGVAFDDLSGEGYDTLAGYRSLLHGARPAAAGYPTQQAEVTAVVAQVQTWLGRGIPPSEIAVCARFKPATQSDR